MSDKQEIPPTIFVLGPPGAGKTYLCQRAEGEMANVQHVVMSSLLDEEKEKADSPWAEEIKLKKPKGVLVSKECTTAVLRSFFEGLPASGKTVYLLDGFPRTTLSARDFDEKVCSRLDPLLSMPNLVHQVGIAKAIISLTCSPEIMEERRLKRARPDDDPAIAKDRERSHFVETIPAILDQEKQGRRVHEVSSEKEGDEGWEVFKTVLQKYRLPTTIDQSIDDSMATKRLLEVERKFHFNMWNIMRQLPPYAQMFKSIKQMKPQQFTDTYFDHRDVLSSNGIWVRRRHGTSPATDVVEAKVRVNGNYHRSTFEEITDGALIHELIRPHFPNVKRGVNDFGLDILAQFITNRRSFLANDKFTVVLDETDFGHAVGEVELMAEDEAEAHGQIDRFMQEYWRFFGKGVTKPAGKLSAYLQTFGVGLRTSEQFRSSIMHR
ncbi:MAG: hypothetical protein Q9212_007282 [Teloschistes hypoglaucus]